MIIVTGHSRSGTSLMMQTLGLLGVPVKGEKFHEDFPCIEGNPKGYYELPYDEAINGLGLEYQGYAVKLLAPFLAYTDINLATHVIVCKRRDVKAQDKSILDTLDKEAKIYTESKIRTLLLSKCLSLTEEDLRQNRIRNYKELDQLLHKYSGQSKTVYFEDMLSDPTNSIKDIQTFLGLTGDITLAVDNVGFD
tara:strand:- start:107 stop:685 length:579 start_codon:yes stop_codon:yes gene_type:complete